MNLAARQSLNSSDPDELFAMPIITAVSSNNLLGRQPDMLQTCTGIPVADLRVAHARDMSRIRDSKHTTQTIGLEITPIRLCECSFRDEPGNVGNVCSISDALISYKNITSKYLQTFVSFFYTITFFIKKYLKAPIFSNRRGSYCILKTTLCVAISLGIFFERTKRRPSRASSRTYDSIAVHLQREK